MNISATTYGINQSVNLMNKTAQNIASGSDDLTTDAVNEIVADNSLSANAAMFSTYDEMMEELVRIGDQRKASM